MNMKKVWCIFWQIIWIICAVLLFLVIIPYILMLAKYNTNGGAGVIAVGVVSIVLLVIIPLLAVLAGIFRWQNVIIVLTIIFAIWFFAAIIFLVLWATKTSFIADNNIAGTNMIIFIVCFSLVIGFTFIAVVSGIMLYILITSIEKDIGDGDEMNDFGESKNNKEKDSKKFRRDNVY